MKEKVVNLLEDAERTIGILMLEINRLNNEIELLKERKNETTSELQSKVKSSASRRNDTSAGIQHRYASIEKNYKRDSNFT